MAWPKGKPKSPEQKEKLRASQVGKVLSVEHRAKIGKALASRWSSKDPSLIAAQKAATLSRTKPIGSRCEHPDGYWLIKTERGWELAQSGGV